MACSKISKNTKARPLEPDPVSTLVVKRVRLPGKEYDDVVPSEFPDYLLSRVEKECPDLMSVVWSAALLESEDCVALTNKGPHKQQALLVIVFRENCATS